MVQLAENLPAMWMTWVQSLGWEDSPGEGKGYPIQYSGLENSMDCIIHRVTKSWTQLRYFHFHFHGPYAFPLYTAQAPGCSEGELSKVGPGLRALPRWLSGKEPARQCKRCRFDPWVAKIRWRRKWQPTPVFLPGESQGREPGGLPSMGSHRVGHD